MSAGLIGSQTDFLQQISSAKVWRTFQSSFFLSKLFSGELCDDFNQV